MGTSLKTTESQLELAKAALARRVKVLEEKKIASLTFESADTNCSPFLVAVTLEKK